MSSVLFRWWDRRCPRECPLIGMSSEEFGKPLRGTQQRGQSSLGRRIGRERIQSTRVRFVENTPPVQSAIRSGRSIKDVGGKSPRF